MSDIATDSEKLVINSGAFEDGGFMPDKYTGFGEDISPEFRILNLPEHTVSIAITFDDLDIPFVGELNHWLIWNIPRTDCIPENIPYGETVTELGGAKQGTAYGKNRYRGPKQPPFIRKTHRYKFGFYALECMLDIDGNSRKDTLLKAIQGHIIAAGTYTGLYKRK